jgi:hypothetical protein
MNNTHIKNIINKQMDHDSCSSSLCRLQVKHYWSSFSWLPYIFPQPIMESINHALYTILAEIVKISHTHTWLLFARVECPRDCTVLTFHMTTPLEGTFAAFHDLLNCYRVSSPTTHEVTPIHPHGRHVASSATRPGHSEPLVTVTYKI